MDFIESDCDNVQGAGPEGKDYAEEGVRHLTCAHR